MSSYSNLAYACKFNWLSYSFYDLTRPRKFTVTVLKIILLFPHSKIQDVPLDVELNGSAVKIMKLKIFSVLKFSCT